MSDDGLMDQSEQLDGDELGEEVGDDYLPELRDYPPDAPQGVDDPSLYSPDDVAVRSLRETADDRPPDDGTDLLRPDDEDSMVDGEAEELAELGEADAGEPVAPEVAAVHVVDGDELA